MSDAWPACASVPTVTVDVGAHGAHWPGLDARGADVWRLAAQILAEEGFDPDPEDTGAFHCRYVGGTATWSKHARRIATDSDWTENPAWARGSIPVDRWAHTTFTPRQIARLTSIRTRTGKQVLVWGGGWSTYYDPMHLEFADDITPADLDGGVHEPGGLNLDMNQIRDMLARVENRLRRAVTAIVAGRRRDSLVIVTYRRADLRRAHGAYLWEVGSNTRRPVRWPSPQSRLWRRVLRADLVKLSIADMRTFEASVPQQG